MLYIQAIQVVNAANGKAILAHPTGQLLRQVRPVALPTNVSLTGQAIQPSASINPATSVIITTPQSNPQASSTITTMSLVNNPNIRLRLPDTPTPPNMLKHVPQVLSQQGKSIVASSIAGSATLIKTNNVPPNQVQTSQQPRMVTIQGHSVILNPNLPSNTQVITTNVSGAGTTMSANNSLLGQPAIGASHQMNSSTSSVLAPQGVVSQQKIIQVRAQPPGTPAMVLGNSQNIFRMPTPTSSSATVVVDAAGSSQTTQLPQAVLDAAKRSTIGGNVGHIVLKRWPTGSPPPTRILQQQQAPGSVITRCLVPNQPGQGTATNRGVVLDGGRPGVVQQQVILSQGQVDQRMQIAEGISSPQQSSGASRVNIIGQQVQPTVFRVEKQPISATGLPIQTSTMNTPLPTTLSLPQVPISSSQLSVSLASASQPPRSQPSPAASPTLVVSRATPSPGRTIFIQQQPGSPQASPGTGTIVVQQQPGTIIPSMKTSNNGNSTLIVQQRQPLPTLPNQPVAPNQLPELFQRPRPPPPPNSANANQNFQNVRILQSPGNSNTGTVRTILIPCTNGAINNPIKMQGGKPVLQIASASGGSASQITNMATSQQIQQGTGSFINNTGTPLPTSIQLPSEPVPFSNNEMSQLSNNMPAPNSSPSPSSINNGRPSPAPSPSRIIIRNDNSSEQSNGTRIINAGTAIKTQDGSKVMIQVGETCFSMRGRQMILELN